MEKEFRKTRKSSLGDDLNAPKDRYRLVYICFLMVGAGFLTPWTSYIAAIDYFFYYYKKEFPTVSVAIPISYLVITFVFGTLNVFLVSRVGVHVRITFGYVMFFISLIIIPMLDIGLHSCAIPTSSGFFITLFSVAIVGIGSGVQQSSYYGLSSMLPRRYTQAVMTGESLAGIVESGFRIITKAIVESERVGAIVFFSFSLLFILACFFCHRFIKAHEMVLFYVNKCSSSDSSRSVKFDSSDKDEDNKLLQYGNGFDNGDNELLLASEGFAENNGRTDHYGHSRDIIEIQELSSPENEKELGRVASSESDSERVRVTRTLLTRKTAEVPSMIRSGLNYMKHCWIVVQQIWPLMAAIFICYFVTLLLFPGILAEVQNCMLGLWTPVIVIASFNLTDFIAKWVTLIHFRWTPKQLLCCSVARVVFIPLILLCVSPSPSHPVLSMNTVVWATLFSLLLGLSNGYYGSLPLINLSAQVKQKKDKELAGTIMTMTLLAGLLAGSVSAYALTPLTTLQHSSQSQCYSDSVQYFTKCSTNTTS